MSRAAFEMDEQLKEIALRVASEMPCLMNHVSIADGVNWTASELLEFATRFLAALPKPESVGVCDTENRIRWDGNDSSRRYSSAPNWLRVGTHIYTEAPPIQSAQGWQPIETAPKDGSVLMLWTKYGEYPIFGKYSATYDEWLEYGGSEYKFTPTHWMPLPAAPGATIPPIAAAKGGAVLSADADNWIKWRGGECPLLPGTLVQIKFSDGDVEIETANNLRWHWEYGGKAGDIVAYRIVQGGAACPLQPESR